MAPPTTDTATESSPSGRVALRDRLRERVVASQQGKADQVEQFELALGLCWAESSTPAVAVERSLSAALALVDLHLDVPALAATLLIAIEPGKLGSLAGLGVHPEVVELVEGARRLVDLQWAHLEEERVETLRKMFVAMARDVRVVLIVLALRCAQVARLADVDDSQARTLAEETLAVHAPLANRLGIGRFKWQLEDAAFRVLDPDAYRAIASRLAETRELREAFIGSAVERLGRALADEQINAVVKGRSKHIFSIHAKMQHKQLSFDQVYDVSALRVITDGVRDCYAVLGIVHSMWTPIPNEFDDYIAMPKGNGYQSLHTAVVGPEGRPVEVQVRTRQMHQLAEFGVAAHWAYKEGKSAVSGGHDRFMLLRQLLDWEHEVIDQSQMVDSLKTDIFEDQVFVFTPGGDVIDLPRGATPIDFAYRVHTQIGHRCRGAKINDQIVPLDRHLKTGDRVEILTQKVAQPSRDWMNPALGYLNTSSARSKVRHWFREQARPDAIQAGREIVSRELSRLNLSAVSVGEVARSLGYPAADDLYAAVGYGDRGPGAVTSSALQLERGRDSEPAIRTVTSRRGPPRGLSLDGVGDIEGQRARCCLPVPGDDVVGFVTRGRGLSIHRRGCAQLRTNQEPERIVEVGWGGSGHETHGVDIEVTLVDRPGVLGEFLKHVSNQGAHIASLQAQGKRPGQTVLRLELECVDATHVALVLSRLSHHLDVLSLRRVSG